MWALVPIKHVSNAKQRLAEELSVGQRDRLCRAMAQDVLDALNACHEIDGITLVSNDDEVAGLAERFSCNFVSEATLGASGLNAVVTAAAARLAKEGVEELMILHADLPLLTPEDVAALIASHREAEGPAVTIATNRHGSGSNGLLVSPPGGMTYCFGEDSRHRHAEKAAVQGRTVTVVMLPGTSLDVDTPLDLAELRRELRGRSDTRTARCLAEQGD